MCHVVVSDSVTAAEAAWSQLRQANGLNENNLQWTFNQVAAVLIRMNLLALVTLITDSPSDH